MTLVYDEAAERGVPKRGLRCAVKKRLLERKIEDIRENLEGDDLDSYDMVLQALGDFGELPLGQAALAAAKPSTPPPPPAAAELEQPALV
jgi:hypothetical protein